MKKRVFILSVIAIAFVLLLSACDQGGASEAQPSGGDSDDSVAITEVQSPEDSTASEEVFLPEEPAPPMSISSAVYTYDVFGIPVDIHINIDDYVDGDRFDVDTLMATLGYSHAPTDGFYGGQGYIRQFPEDNISLCVAIGGVWGESSFGNFFITPWDREGATCSEEKLTVWVDFRFPDASAATIYTTACWFGVDGYVDIPITREEAITLVYFVEHITPNNVAGSPNYVSVDEFASIFSEFDCSPTTSNFPNEYRFWYSEP